MYQLYDTVHTHSWVKIGWSSSVLEGCFLQLALNSSQLTDLNSCCLSDFICWNNWTNILDNWILPFSSTYEKKPVSSVNPDVTLYYPQCICTHKSEELMTMMMVMMMMMILGFGSQVEVKGGRAFFNLCFQKWLSTPNHIQCYMQMQVGQNSALFL